MSKRPDLVAHYTELPSASEFIVLLELCLRFPVRYYHGWNVEVITKEDQLFCTLMKLRRNFSMFDLTVRFGVSHTAIANILHTGLSVLHCILEESVLRYAPPSSPPSCLLLALKLFTLPVLLSFLAVG